MVVSCTWVDDAGGWGGPVAKDTVDSWLGGGGSAWDGDEACAKWGSMSGIGTQPCRRVLGPGPEPAEGCCGRGPRRH